MASNGACRWRGRCLTLLVLLVVAVGAACLVWAVRQVSLQADPLAGPVVMTLLVAVAGSGAVFLRTRSQHLLTITGSAVLVAVVMLPAGWAVICTAVGYAAATAVRRQLPRQPHKAAFNIAKETLGATCAVVAAQSVAMTPAATLDQPITQVWGSYLLALCVAAVAYAAVDEIVPPPVIALASHTPWRQVARRDLDIRTVTRVVDLVIAAAAVALAVIDLRLLVLVPAAVLVAHLVYVPQLRLREERRAWQQLAAAAEALTAAGGHGELSRVLHTAVIRTAALFPAAEVEIATFDDSDHGGRVVRGGPNRISYDGPAAHAPPTVPPAAELPLAAPPGDEPIGTLRLRLHHSPATLTDREPQLLQALAPHLATALRNTTAYAAAVHRATHDPLTKLPNRRQLHQHLADLLEDTHPAADRVVAVMLIDLDYFKEINDTAGHPAGDRALTEAARRVHTAADGALAARLGGDEFAVVLQVPTATEATQRAKHVLEALRGPYLLDGTAVKLDASAGLATTTGGIGGGELLRRADVALYEAKASTDPVRLTVYQHHLDHPETNLAKRSQRADTNRHARARRALATLASAERHELLTEFDVTAARTTPPVPDTPHQPRTSHDSP